MEEYLNDSHEADHEFASYESEIKATLNGCRRMERDTKQRKY